LIKDVFSPPIDTASPKSVHVTCAYKLKCLQATAQNDLMRLLVCSPVDPFTISTKTIITCTYTAFAEK
jgi:hypothetical protein